MISKKVKLRITFLFLLFLSLVLIVFLILKSLEENVVYFKSPTEIQNLSELTKKKSKNWWNGKKKLYRDYVE